MQILWKVLRTILLVLAILIALTYTFGYDYLFRGIAKTYLRGENSATIDDEELFPKNAVAAGKPRPWIKDSNYNKQKLPAELLKKLSDANTSSFLIVKDGKLLHEQYWNGSDTKTRTNSFSVAKTVTVMLLGKAIEDEFIRNEDQLFSDFYGNYADDKLGKSLTLRNLAQMESGLNWTENYTNPFLPNAKLYYGSNLAEATFLKGFKNKPGTHFEYQSGTTQLLGFAIRKSAQMPLSSYLSKKLWIPLGMEENAFWGTDDFKVEKAYCCIYAASRDFAKLGQLFLDNGKVDSTQIISSAFIEEMRTPTKLSKDLYGMGLWINNDSAVKHYFMLGLQGQYVIMVPEKNMVIVRTGAFKNQTKNDRGRPDLVREIVESLSKYY